MKKKMKKSTNTSTVKHFIWLWIVAAYFVYTAISMLIGGDVAGFAISLVIAAAFGVPGYFSFKKVKKERDQKTALEQQEVRKREESAQKAAEWDRKNGRFDYKVAGVTYDNDDGSSRQKYLSQIMKALSLGEEVTIHHEMDTYKGKPCVRVMFDDKCVGFVPKQKVDSFVEIADRITSIYPEIDVMEDEYIDDDEKTHKEKIYYCHVYLVYSK